ncbi:hypothetical protein ASAC_0066 [Acidilobus saccharovorans 345-15]|uniref:DUF5320 domain-containing protein n=1 Tax=Acidilobus saccharovorans (strain DSM 16705 / JCM 18335 / VKM B-2471 / 345-15) TaxID=666510 RepID=D9PZI6_ACIS3|nr:DUF5320 domain-containing protein [Acidilobus saccharovorans]ADL18474.1 hypothetical protein ASAC_0066 [Acidilobus saccharovorans 345-15]
MGWWRFGRWGGGPWPGHGPFSYLPPWERPGWAMAWYGYYGYYDKDSELRALEAYRLYLEDLRSWADGQLKEVDRRIAELKGQQANA